VHRIGKSDEDGIDLGERLVVLVVAVRTCHLVFAAERLELGRVVADEGGQDRIAAGVRKGWENRGLGNVAEPDNRIPN